jgi:hypothetical protein
METDSENVGSIFDKWGWDGAAQEAKRNEERPSEGIAKASVATGLGFLGAGAGNWLGGAGAYEAAVPAMNSQQAAMLAAQTGEFGGYGLGQTMRAASGAQGLSGFQSGLANTGGGLLSGGLSGGGGAGSKNMMQLMQAANMVSPQQQPQMPAPLPRQGQMPALDTGSQGYQPMRGMSSMPRYMTEEEKKRYRMMRGY